MRALDPVLAPALGLVLLACGCAARAPSGRPVPSREAAHDLVVDNRSEEFLVVHVGRTLREALEHAIGVVWPLDAAAFQVAGPACEVWITREGRTDLEAVGTWRGDESLAEVVVR